MKTTDGFAPSHTSNGMAVRVQAAGRTLLGTSEVAEAFVIAPIARAMRGPSVELEAVALLLGVSEGLGGIVAGSLASALVVDGLLRSRLALSALGTATLRAAVLRAHVRVPFVRHDEWPHRHTALAAALVMGQVAYVANVGRSRVYLLRDDSLVTLVRDEHGAKALVAEGTLVRIEGPASTNKHVLAPTIGIGHALEVEVHSVSLCKGDRLVLCTESHDADHEIVANAEPGESVREACDRLATAAKPDARRAVTVLVAEIADGASR